jgi:hypothetical protein
MINAAQGEGTMIGIRSHIPEHPIFKHEMVGATCEFYVGNESLGVRQFVAKLG